MSDWLERKASHLDRESFSLGALASCCTTSSKEVDGFFLLPPTPTPPILFRLFSPEVFGIALVVEGDEEFAAGDSPCLLRTCRSQELRAWKDLGHCKHFQGWPSALDYIAGLLKIVITDFHILCLRESTFSPFLSKICYSEQALFYRNIS